MLSILGQETAIDHPALAPLWLQLPRQPDLPKEFSNFSPQRIIPKDSAAYYYYEGSLTSPPCREKIQWIVFRDAINISAKQIDQLLKLSRFNARPLQSLGERKVFRSW